MTNQPGIDQLAINTIRLPVIDAVQKTRSGHSGTPPDAAPAYALWRRILCYRADPGWINRNRFVLSSGHASILLYSRRELPPGWEGALAVFPPSQSGRSTPCASGQVLNAVAQLIPWLIGGAADLAPGTKTPMTFEAAGDFQADGPLGDHRGRNLYFGIREHTMCVAVSDITLRGPRAVGSGFFILTDLARGSIRLASLMDLPALHIWTHDLISVGKDGPTHEPIEQLVSLRAIPKMSVIRRADANEISEAYSLYLSAPRPIGQLNRLAAGAANRRSREPSSRRRRARQAGGWQTGRHRYCRRQQGHIVTGGARPTDHPRYQRAQRHHALIGGTAAGDGESDRRGMFAAGLGPPCGPAGIALGMQTFGMPVKVPDEHFDFTADAVAAAKRAQRHTPNL